MTIWQWVAVSIICNIIYNSGWNEQRRFVTGHGNLTICPATKSGNQRSAISHNPVAHKWLWTRCSYPYIRGSGFRFRPGSQLCRLSCRMPLVVFWFATVIIMVSFTNHDLTGNVQSGTDLDFCQRYDKTSRRDIYRCKSDDVSCLIILYLFKFYTVTQKTWW